MAKFGPAVKTVAKVVLILTGALALFGGGTCAAANILLMPNLVVIGISLLVAALGWSLVMWGKSLRPTEETDASSSNNPGDPE